MNPSLSVGEDAGGAAWVKCRAGCQTDEVLAAVGLAKKDLFPRSGKRRSWDIRDAGGEVVAVHHRTDKADGKAFWWARPDGEKGLGGVKTADVPLYRSEEAGGWPTDTPVILCEGEKTADALAGAYPATLGTVTGANGTPGPEALEVLRGRPVVLWPDADDPGRQHMNRIADRLRGVADKVKIFDWPDAPPGGDAADHPAVRERDAEALLGEIRAARRPEPRGPGILLSNVEPEKVEWLWPGRIPYGKVSIIDGDPGQGKSALTIDLAARITRGREWPDGGRPDPGGAVICSAEDGLADTIRPRLDAAGGDPQKVLALATVPLPGDSERMIEIPADLDLLREAIRQVDARLLIIDPLMAFLPPEADAHKDQHVRRALSPLAKMAESTGCAVVVVRHLNKGGGTVLYRGGGSVGIIGAARSGMLVAPHPEDDDLRVLAPTKNNLAAHAPTLAFCMREAANGAVRVEWRGETTLTAEAALAGPTDHETRDLRRAVEDLIRERGGEIEATPRELHDSLAERDLAALPDRPDELSKKLPELARTSTTGLTVTRGWRGKERVLRLGHR